MRPSLLIAVAGFAIAYVGVADVADAQSALSGETIRMARAAGGITIDGDLGDEGWHGAVRVTRWYETRPGDNSESPVRNVGYLTYDERFFYAAFEFDDPDPARIRAPYADRDNIGDGFNDYGGIVSTDRAPAL